MAVRIDRSLCNGCGRLREPRCVRVCPGDLLYRDGDNRCSVRDSRDCWDCAACVKECPRMAIEMYQPVQIGGRGAVLKARTKKDFVCWTLTRPDGTQEYFEIITRRDQQTGC